MSFALQSYTFHTNLPKMPATFHQLLRQKNGGWNACGHPSAVDRYGIFVIRYILFVAIESLDHKLASVLDVNAWCQGALNHLTFQVVDDWLFLLRRAAQAPLRVERAVGC